MAARKIIYPILPIRPLPPFPFPYPFPRPIPTPPSPIFEGLDVLTDEEILKISPSGYKRWARTYFYSTVDTHGR